MQMFAFSLRSRVFGVATAFGLMAAGACADASSDPLAVLVTPETAASLEVPVELLNLVDLARQAGLEQELAPDLAAWEASWIEGARDTQVRDRQVRDKQVRDLAPRIAQALGAGGTSAALAPLLQVRNDLALIADLPGDLVPQVEEVHSLMDEARLALAEGRSERALEAGLKASDRLRDLGPTAVARTLIARADRALMATIAAPRVDGLSLSRGERLLNGARTALDEGQEELAVQRAFYAVQLLEQALNADRPTAVDTIG